MISINRILCAIDFSPSTGGVLASAAALARYHDATLTVLYVSQARPVPAGPTEAGPRSARSFWHERLHERTVALVDQPREVTTVVREGDPVRRILDEAVGIGADLVVVGTKGRGGLSRLLLGSVAEAVLERATCPVLTVPPAAFDRSVLEEAGLFGRILCPIDFSKSSLAALDHALALAQEAQGLLILLRIVDRIAAVRDDWQARDAARDDVLRLVPSSAHHWCTVQGLVTTGEPSERILRVALDEEMDLIVMGVPHESGLRLDSTAGRVVREAACPVMTVRGAPAPAAVRRTAADAVAAS